MRELKAGDKVICHKRGKWVEKSSHGDSDHLPAPAYGDECTIAEVWDCQNGVWLSLEGYLPETQSFNARHFVKSSGKK